MRNALARGKGQPLAAVADDRTKGFVDALVATIEGNDHHPDPGFVEETAEALVARAQRQFGDTALGEVARDLAVAAQLACGATQCGDHDVGPEPRPILTNPPTLILEATLGRCGLKLGLTRCDVLAWVKHREVPADDLLGTIALQALRPGVPGRHVPAGVQQQDRVVFNVGDEDVQQVVVANLGVRAPVSGGSCSDKLSPFREIDKIFVLLLILSDRRCET